MTRGVLVVVLTLAAACSKSSDVASEESIPPRDTSKAAVSSIPARWVPLRPAGDASMLSAPCVVRAEAHATGEVSSSFRVQIQDVHVQVGDLVRRGQAIVEVTSPDVVSAAATYLGLSSRLKVHRERLAALGDLRKEGMVRTSAVFEQQALVAELSAGMREAAAVLRLAGLSAADAGRIVKSTRLTLSAPVDGVVASISAHPGEVLDGAMTFAEISAPARARIEVSSPGALAPSTSISMLTADGFRYELIPQPVSTVVQTDSGMHLSWFDLKDRSAVLNNGLRCSVEFSVSEDLWEVPSGAVADGTTLVRRRGDVVAKIPVVVLSGSGASVLVRGDLQAGDFVSANGSAAGPGAP